MGCYGRKRVKQRTMKVRNAKEGRAREEAVLELQDRVVGLVVKVSDSKAEDPGFESRLRWDFSGIKFYRTVSPKLAIQWLPYQASGVIGSVLGLVGPLSVYCDWVRWKV